MGASRLILSPIVMRCHARVKMEIGGNGEGLKKNSKIIVDFRTAMHHSVSREIMDALLNKTVRLSQEQISGLEKEAVRRNRKLTELIRIAVDEMLLRKAGKRRAR